MKPGRIETYVHSDMTTANKGVGVVRVRTETDFAAKDQVFIDFCKKAAQVAFATGAMSWNDIILAGEEHFSSDFGMSKGLYELQTYLGEDIYIDEVWSSSL